MYGSYRGAQGQGPSSGWLWKPKLEFLFGMDHVLEGHGKIAM